MSKKRPASQHHFSYFVGFYLFCISALLNIVLVARDLVILAWTSMFLGDIAVSIVNFLKFPIFKMNFGSVNILKTKFEW
jgi:hypothetical protein